LVTSQIWYCFPVDSCFHSELMFAEHFSLFWLRGDGIGPHIPNLFHVMDGRISERGAFGDQQLVSSGEKHVYEEGWRCRQWPFIPYAARSISARLWCEVIGTHAREVERDGYRSWFVWACKLKR
jgi:hypothetical protein